MLQALNHILGYELSLKILTYETYRLLKERQQLTVRTHRQSQSTKLFFTNPSQTWDFELSIVSKSTS